MNKSNKDYLIILFFTILLFIPLFIRTEMIGIYDTYYYLNYIFGKTSVGLWYSLGIIKSFFKIFPANFLVLKLIMFSICLISSVIFYNTCKLYSKKYAIYGVSLLLTFTFFAKLFVYFETAIFSLPFMFLSFYFINKYAINPTKNILDKNIILSILFLFPSIIFWRFTIYYIPAFLLTTGFHLLYILATWSIIPFTPFLFQYATPVLTTSEAQPIKALIPLSFLYLGFVPKFIKKYNIMPTIFLLFLSLLKYKFIYLLIPFVIINLIVFVSQKDNMYYKIILFLIISVFLIGTTYSNITSLPNDDSKYIIELAKGLKYEEGYELNINWSLDYYSQWHGIETYYSGYTNPLKYNEFVLTYPQDPELKKNNCKKIEETKEIWLYYC